MSMFSGNMCLIMPYPTPPLPSDHVDGAVHRPARPPHGRHSGAGGGGQLPAAQPHRRADGGHVAHHEGGRDDPLRPA